MFRQTSSLQIISIRENKNKNAIMIYAFVVSGTKILEIGNETSSNDIN